MDDNDRTPQGYLRFWAAHLDKAKANDKHLMVLWLRLHKSPRAVDQAQAHALHAARCAFERDQLTPCAAQTAKFEEEVARELIALVCGQDKACIASRSEAAA